MADADLTLEALAATIASEHVGRGLVTLDRIVRNQAVLANALLRIIERLEAAPPRRVKPVEPLAIPPPGSAAAQMKSAPKPCAVCGTTFRPRSKGARLGYTQTCSRMCGAALRQRATAVA
ncbi:MAG: hypothetical protein L3K06_08045 [Thermoplasmata archaeon]|nr:hypothetical protein [Thermoplasmata archaeon]